ncbi:MAG: hypothetical protein ACUVSQ_06435 [Pseudanabaenaceae cyanobacterium]
MVTKAESPIPEATASPEQESAARLRRARLEAVFIPTKSLAERRREVQQELVVKKGNPFAQSPGTVVLPRLPRPALPPVRTPPPPRLSLPVSRPVSSPVRPTPATVRPQPQLPLAATLKVTGVVDMGSDIYAIVSVPGDLTSQYVRRGQRLVSGIYVQDVFAGASPGVVVQQNGRRFVRYVN